MDNNDITSVSLSEYLNDSDAPPGFVWLVDGRPELQVDVFPNHYTVFWLGSVNARSVLWDFMDVFNETMLEPTGIRRLFRPRFYPFVKGRLSVVKKNETSRGSPFTRAEEEFEYRPRGQTKSRDIWSRSWMKIDVGLPSLELTSERQDFASVQIDWTLMTKPVRQFSLWGDTFLSPTEEKEVGMTLNMPVPNKFALRHFMLETSTSLRKLPSPVFDELFDLMRRKTSEGTSEYELQR